MVGLIGLVMIVSSSGNAAASPFPQPAKVPTPAMGSWASLGGSIPLAPAGASAVPGTTHVVGSLAFTGRDPAGQAELLQDLYTPGSPGYHQFLTGDQWDQLFGPDPASQAELMGYLEGDGLQVEVSSSLLWTVVGTAAEMGAAFDTTFAGMGAGAYAPVSPLQLPASFSSDVQLNGGFQTYQQIHPTDLVAAPHPIAQGPASPTSTPGPREQGATPAAALTINMTNAFLYQYQKAGGLFFPPTGMNVTWTLTISGGTAPYTVSWHWGDGSMQSFTTSAASLPEGHLYVQPSQTDWCGICGNITVWVNDSAGNKASEHEYLVPGQSPVGDQLYYNVVPLYRLGYSGAGTRIGFDEMCDESFTNYATDFNDFSAEYGLPQNSSSNPILILTGNGNTLTKCEDNGGGATGWNGETMLDIEWAHVIAPNATLYVDLGASSIDEGDSSYSNTAYEIYVDSNSWGCPQNDTAEGCPTRAAYTTLWQKIASQGQTFMASSGDCGAYELPNAWPATVPWSMGVGGTDVYPFPSGTFRTEFAWNGTTATTGPTCEEGNNDDGSTGGCSTAFNTPWYQAEMTGFSTACPAHDRGVPDVAFIGGTWVSYYDTDVYGALGWGLEAGTSLASPSYAAVMDLVYQYNGTAGKGNGLADFDLYNIASSSNYHIGMHDILVGENKVSGTGYSAGVGWDPVTGIGSANVSELAELMAEQNGNPDAISALTAVLAVNTTFEQGGPESLSVFFGADVAGGPSSLTGYSYQWTFGDGNTATTSVPYTEHTYTCSGWPVASVSVTAGGDTGTSNAITMHTIYGSACPTPVNPGTFTLNRTANACETTCGIAANITFSGGTGALTAQFRWGDGTGPQSVAVSGGSAMVTYRYDPATTTSYTPRVYVNDTHGDWATMVPSQALTVYPLLQLQPITPSHWHLGTPDNETFSAIAAQAGTGSGTLSTYSWTYGNGNTASTAAGAPFEVYYTAGAYTISAVATDSLGYRAGASVTIDVTGTASSLHVSTGWNLVALPSGSNDYSLFEIAQLLSTQFTSVQDLTSGTTFTTGAATGNSAVNAGDALWVDVSGPETITLYGNATTPTVSFAGGAWSAIGWSAGASTSLLGIANLAGSGTLAVSAWNATSQTWVTYVGSFDGATSWLATLPIVAGQAVMVYVSGAGSFTE